MTGLVASGYLSDNARTNAEMQLALEALRDFIATLEGANAPTELTIATGAIIPPEDSGGGWHTLDTEGNAASDDLATATTTYSWEGRRIVFAAENASRVVTIKHAAGGSGQFLMADDADFVFADLDDWIEFRLKATDWVEVNRRRVPLQVTPTIEWLTSGTAATYTRKTGAKKIVVECWGPGGGSGGVDGQVGGSAISGAGAGGAYCIKEIAPPAATYTYTVGLGGTGGASGNNAGSTGTSTTFTDGASINLSAASGAGGAGMLGTSGTVLNAGSAGGAATGGDINIKGGDSGSRAVVGGVAVCLPTSGSAPLINGGIRANTTGAGIAIGAYGEGGGAAHSNDATNYAGTTGGGGLIKVTTYY